MFLLVLGTPGAGGFPSISNLSKYNHHSLRKRLSILIIRFRLNKKSFLEEVLHFLYLQFMFS